MSEPAVIVERDGHVVTITLNRPDKRNAFNAELSAAVRAAFRETFEVSAGSSVIATGTVGADPITVPAGTYRVAVRGAGERDLGEVTIVAEETRELSF